ncbi:PopZ family protein [Sinorhizobium garamanticum]|uniref:PopZ family protein n=1 Tax=Sinorhizobium garamanticum TaxID=680247 RepID=A0ABY8DAA3_9HYPH|nr:PopZ family protein [Sinorhizobium garamanticum]WEX87232.1 PopZ family protein [Sinorhizobium garamanticum]
MAQLNVAREPSMDEILASIRKIIENNEPGQMGSSVRHEFEDEAGDEIELTIDSEIEAVAFGASEEPRSSSRTPSYVSAVEATGNAAETQASPQPPLSLADVAARVRAASERHAVNYVSKDHVDPAPMPPVQNNPVITSRMAAVSSPATPVNTGATRAEDAAVGDVAGERIVPEPDTSSQATVREKMADAEETPASAIVSPAVSRQVARSFEDLAHAVEQGPRRSFDEIAEAMLRPMLQEWLDDNLPTLVERLVREEIERVARGPRR